MTIASKTTELIEFEGGQIVKIPPEFRFNAPSVVIRQEGESLIIDPVKPQTWPPGFFDEIFIDDPAFVRPDQGEMPPAPSLD